MFFINFVLDILCIQVSTVASESAFSASGRVLDPYRNCLSPTIVEALVCTQDWIRTSSRNITLDTLEDLMKDDEIAKGKLFIIIYTSILVIGYCRHLFCFTSFLEIQEALDKQKGEKEKNL